MSEKGSVMQNNGYNSSIGYLKAFGIILMVLGHSGNNLHVNDFIDMFHMPLFFIASGYCFKEKYLSEPKMYIRNKIKGIWWPYVKWGVAFFLLHNLFFYLNIYDTHYDYLENSSNLFYFPSFLKPVIHMTITMHGTEPLLGGYWFLNALFFGSIIAWCVFRFVKNLILGGGILLCISCLLNATNYIMPFMQISARNFAAALFIVIGYALRKYKMKTFHPWQIVLGLLLVLVGSFYWHMPMHPAISDNRKFIPYIVSATVATWCFYSLFLKMEDLQGVIPRTLTFLGKHTLTILTWHILAFKIVSLIIVSIYSLPVHRLAEHPVIIEYAEKGWWLAYFVTAIVVTSGIAYCNKWIGNVWLKI